MHQNLAINRRYRIKTPTGWESFDGILCNTDDVRNAVTINTSTKSITVTVDHRLYSNSKEVRAGDLVVGDVLDTDDGQQPIISLLPTQLPLSYDVLNTETHTVTINGIHSHNCDELAFVRKTIAHEFWTAMQPTLSCLPADTLILTDNGYMPLGDLFPAALPIGIYLPLDHLNVWGMMGMEPASHGYISPDSETVIITLSNGMKVEGTMLHPFYQLKEEGGEMTPAMELQPGDFLRVDYGMRIFGKATLSPEAAEQIGRHYATGRGDEVMAVMADRGQLLVNRTEFQSWLYQADEQTTRNFFKGLFYDVDLTRRRCQVRVDNINVARAIQMIGMNYGIPSSISEHEHIVRLTFSPTDRLMEFFTDKRVRFEETDILDWQHVIASRLKDIAHESGYSREYFRNHSCRIGRIDDHSITGEWIHAFRAAIGPLAVKYASFFHDLCGIIENPKYPLHRSHFMWVEIDQTELSANTTYDLTVPGTHAFLQNGIMGSNTGGSCIITSTPNSDEDLFAQIWFAASRDVDDNGEVIPGGVGINGFKPILIRWNEHPERDAEWEARSRRQIGDSAFEREHACTVGDTRLTIETPDGQHTMTILELFNRLRSDAGRYAENRGWKVLSEGGFVDFAGVVCQGVREVFRVTFYENVYIDVTANHRFIDWRTREVFVSELQSGNKVLCANGKLATVMSVESLKKWETVYDLMDVNGHVFYTNGILSHNCEFVSADSTLIDGKFLATGFMPKNPISRTGTVRWFETLQPNMTYVVGLDPSGGTGNGDPAAIQIWELPTMQQVGEWVSETATQLEQVRTLLLVLNYIDRTLSDHPDQEGDVSLYWSFENNSVGAGIAEIIRNTGYDRFPGTLVNEKKKGFSVNRKKGLNTNASTKLNACMKLKHFIESRLMIVQSRALISELKTFVGNGISYEAKAGSRDDLVMSTLLCVRMFDQIAKHDEEVKDRVTLSVDEDDDEFLAPMPMIL